jgi:hypothetical protein
MDLKKHNMGETENTMKETVTIKKKETGLLQTSQLSELPEQTLTDNIKKDKRHKY